MEDQKMCKNCWHFGHYVDRDLGECRCPTPSWVQAGRKELSPWDGKSCEAFVPKGISDDLAGILEKVFDEGILDIPDPVSYEKLPKLGSADTES